MNNFTTEQREEVMDTIAYIAIASGLYDDENLKQYLIEKISHLAATIFSEEEIETLTVVIDSKADEVINAFAKFIKEKEEE